MKEPAKRISYSVCGTKYMEANIMASSLREAAQIFIQRYPGVVITDIDGVEPVGTCEASGQLILPGDDYVADAEGGYLLRAAWERL